MNNKTLLFGLIVVVLLGGGAYVLTQSQSQPSRESMTKKSDEVMMEKTDSPVMENADGAMIKSESRYMEYSQSAFQSAAGKRRVLFFYANWCPTCRPTDAAFQSNMSQIPEDVVVFRVNYNDPDTDQGEKDLSANYGITYQHTFVQVDANGNEVATWNGGQLNELLSNIQ